MTAYQLYLVDDALPTFTRGPLSNDAVIEHSALRGILQDKELDWSEPPVRDLLEKALANPEWNVSAARNPELFLRNLEISLDRPDVLIFDWDYPGLTKPAEDFLAEYLEKTYCLVRVYTGIDKLSEVEDLLGKERFALYRQRISLSEKTKVDADALLREVQAKRESNFSFKFGTQLRRTAVDSLEKILVSLGTMSIDETMALLSTIETTEDDFKEMLVEKIRNHLREDQGLFDFLSNQGMDPQHGQALIDLIAEKLRSDLISSDVRYLSRNLGGVSAADERIAVAAAKLWSYRLYHHPSDTNVRRGDIIQNKQTGACFVVISADCDLNRLWQKNYGFLNVVPIFEMKQASTILAAHFRFTKIKATSFFKPASLIGVVAELAEGTLLLPFVPLGKTQLSFLVFPKEIKSFEISPPKNADTVDKIRNSSLSYECLAGFSRVCTISEPFLTPFVHTLLQALAGLGVPDYPAPVKSVIHERSKAALST